MKRIIIHSLITLIGMAILSACGGDPTPVNHAPVATAQSVTMAEDTAKAITLAGTDEDNITLIYTVASNPTHGTLSGTAPNLTYTPAANFNGSDSFTFTVNDGTVDSNASTVTITVSAVNDAPTASGFSLTLDVDKSTATGNWRTLSSAINAIEGDALTASVATQGHYGTFAIVGDAITYFKTAETNVTDSGTLNISDGHDSVSVAVTINALYWKQLASKKDFTIALKSDGTVWGWGSNRYGQLGDGTTIDRDHPVQESTHATDWIQVAAGYTHTVAVKSNGTLWSWGENNSGQLGNNTSVDSHTPVQESSLSTYWVKATAGENFTVAKTSSGTLYAWGYNGWGQLGIDATGNRDEPTPIDGGSSGWSDIAAGWAHVVALKTNGQIWSWGYNYYGQLGNGSNGMHRAPVREATLADDWKSIACGSSWSLAIKNDDTLYAWGDNGYGQLGIGSWGGHHYQPTAVGSEHWLNVRAGYKHSLGIQTDGSLWGWGSNEKSQLGSMAILHYKNEPFRIGTDNDWIGITASRSTSIAIKNNHLLYGWGYNKFGQLGNKKTDTQYTPLHILSAHTWRQISIGEHHVLAIRDDRTLWAWGSDGWGQLGDGPGGISNVYNPVQEATHATTWKSVAAGANFSVGLQTDGSLWTWGANTSGQLGLGNNDSKDTPTHVGMDSWSHICAGASHAAAIRTNGHLYAWGGNGSGQLGIGNNIATNTPTREAGNLVWKEVACGDYHTVGIHATADTLWAWGSNSNGQLGIGNNDSKNVPTQVTGSWLKVAAGKHHTLAIKSGETLWSWGENATGQLGNGSWDNTNTPGQIGTQADWGIIAAGGDTSMAIHMEVGGDTVWVWGDNAGGQFGIEGRGTQHNNQPQEITSLRGTTAALNVSLSISLNSIGLVKDDGTMWTWGTNDDKRLARDWYTKTPDKLIERAP